MAEDTGTQEQGQLDDTTDAPDPAIAKRPPKDDGDDEQVQDDHSKDGDTDSDVTVDQVSKGLQKHQMKTANFHKAMEARMEEFGERLETVLAKIESQGGAATKADKKELEDIKDEAEDLDDDDLLTVRGFRKQQKAMIDEITKAVEERMDRTMTPLREEAMTAKQQRERASYLKRFDRDNPDLKGRGEEVLDEYNQIYEDRYGGIENVPQAKLNQCFSEAFDRVKQRVASEAGESRDDQSKKPDPKRSTAGTNVKAKGATSRSEGSKPPAEGEVRVFAPGRPGKKR